LHQVIDTASERAMALFVRPSAHRVTRAAGEAMGFLVRSLLQSPRANRITRRSYGQVNG